MEIVWNFVTCALHQILLVMEANGIRQAEHVAHMGHREMDTEFSPENQDGRCHFGGQGVNGRII
jgi:hypothetical protein